MFQKLKRQYAKHTGAWQAGLRAAAAAGLIVGAYLFVFLYFRHTAFFGEFLRIPGDFYIDWLTGLRKTDFLNAVLFTLVIFVLWNRATLKALKPYYQPLGESVVWLAVAIGIQVGHYVLKYWIVTNMDTALAWAGVLTLVKYLLNGLFVLAVVLACFGWSFVVKQVRVYAYQLIGFIGVGIGFFFLIQLFQSIWRVFGNIAALTIGFLLGLTFENTQLDIAATRAPILQVNDFRVAISQECSGIDSLLLFLALFATLLVLDWDRFDKRRLIVLFVIGVFGTWLYNIIRIYSLMLVGIFISPEFAVDMFHTNAGWMLFLLFFIVYWHFGSKWVYVKPAQKTKR